MATGHATTRWVPQAALPVDLPARLFCVPHAGGGASNYSSWRRELANQIDVLPVQLPGREERMRETPRKTFSTLVDELTEALRPLLDRKYFMFGHSMGALLNFELLRRLRAENLPLPEHVYIAACRAPHQRLVDLPISELSDDDFVQVLDGHYGGLPREVREDPELMQLLLDVLRADFAAVESYQYEPQPPFDLPFTVLGGVDDMAVSREHLAAWGEHTRGKFSVHRFPGDHFFVKEARSSIQAMILQEMEAR